MEEDQSYNVVYVGKFSGEISHEVDRTGLREGDGFIACWIGNADTNL